MILSMEPISLSLGRISKRSKNKKYHSDGEIVVGQAEEKASEFSIFIP